MIITDSGSTIEREEYRDENELQELIYNRPELISDDNSELTSIMREVNTRAGRIDILDITDSGIITIVEVKLARNPQSRREVLAQIFDYISELSSYSYYQLNDATNNALEKAIESFENYDELRRLIEVNLKNGIVRLIIAVDESNEGLKRLAEFVARHTDFRIDLVEVKKYKNGDNYLYGSNVVVESNSQTITNRSEGRPVNINPLLKRVTTAWEASGKKPIIGRKESSYSQLFVENWPKALHYEFTIMRNKPIIYVRLDNELHADAPLTDKISNIMKTFEGREICGHKIQARPYRRSGSGMVLSVALGEDEIDLACETMEELITLTKSTIDDYVAK
ncbi:DUF91 domain-containing protein [Candidatus Saccharibacteria bacterium]|nr:DUF91 domain-containing protein [Candidatus Saccharibacteria bacterium]